MNDISWADYYEALSNNCKKESIPIYVGLELTPLCNFNCKMCYIHISKEEQEKRAPLLSADQWIDIAKQAYDMGTLSLTLSGGEVFTRPDFRYIYETLSDMGFMITIYTNGYLINDSVIEWLSERPPHRVRVSIYGASDETYQAVTGISNGYSVVKSNIEKMLAADISVNITMTVIKDNEHDIDAVETLTNSWGIPFSASRGLINPLPGVDKNIDGLKATIQAGRKDEDACPSAANTSAFYMCNSYKKSCWITWDGYMQLCPALYAIKEKCGDLSTNWNNMNSRLALLTVPQKCTECRYEAYCQQCPGSLLSESGTLGQVNEKCCHSAIQRYNMSNKNI